MSNNCAASMESALGALLTELLSRQEAERTRRRILKWRFWVLKEVLGGVISM